MATNFKNIIGKDMKLFHERLYIDSNFSISLFQYFWYSDIALNFKFNTRLKQTCAGHMHTLVLIKIH